MTSYGRTRPDPEDSVWARGLGCLALLVVYLATVAIVAVAVEYAWNDLAHKFWPAAPHLTFLEVSVTLLVSSWVLRLLR